MTDPNLLVAQTTHSMVEAAIAAPAPYDPRTVAAVLDLVKKYADSQKFSGERSVLRAVGTKIAREIGGVQ